MQGIQLIGFVGSMFPYHGVDILIDAFNLVQKDNRKIKLMIIGDGIVLNNLKSQVEKLNLKNDVIFTGKVPHNLVFTYIKMMDICIMAKSNWYGSPVKIFEYGLMQKPIIAPNNGPVNDVIENEVDAILINENKMEIVKAIQRLLKDESFAKKMASEFHQKVMHKYIWSNAASKIIKECTLQ